jgi:hypothetical protein
VVASLENLSDSTGTPSASSWIWPEPLTGSALCSRLWRRRQGEGACGDVSDSRVGNAVHADRVPGIEGKAFSQQLYDPGITRFSIQVRDIDAAFARVKDRVVVNSTGARRCSPEAAQQHRAVMMHDLMVSSSSSSGRSIPETNVPTSNVLQRPFVARGGGHGEVAGVLSRSAGI